jgi:phospholipase C
MSYRSLLAATCLATFAGLTPTRAATMADIQTVVVIYAENRSFDNLWGSFPGANGLAQASASSQKQLDRDGKPLAVLPPDWSGLTGKGITPVVSKAETENRPNAPFAIDDPKGFDLGLGVTTADLWHRFYENQMQIDGGKNDRFAAWADAGGMVMGHYDGSKQRLWKIAQDYVLADNFFMGAFGGSFMNHQWLICACVTRYPDADHSPAKSQISLVEEDGVTLSPPAAGAGSALDGPAKFANSGGLTPDFYAVNTMQPPYQPSANPPAPGGDPRFADPSKPTTLPPQTGTTIGDLLSAKGVSWAWYGGAWQAALDKVKTDPPTIFQYHHQPFNYYAQFAPGTPARAEHLRDGGVNGAGLIADIRAGTLPAVTFYKPQGNLNQHAGYANVMDGDAHIADVVGELERSPQWPHMLVVITYDENGGFWDHVAPPVADRWGPGTRVPALIISPFAKRGVVDHTQYDTTSILRFITARFGLPELDGIKARDAGVLAHGGVPFGDLTQALVLTK